MENCEQGSKLQLDFQKQISDDRLAHQKAIDVLVTKVTVQTEKVSLLMDATEKAIKATNVEIKECKDERGWLQKRVNKIWTAGAGALLTVIGWLVTNHFKGH